VAPTILSNRALNRASLERQGLLRRVALPVTDALTHLVGLQAQVPLNPYHALWSRLEAFDPDELGRLMLDRQVVRIVCMRGTIHLVTASDALVLRPMSQSVLDREMRNHRDHAPVLRDLDLAPILAFGREFFADPRTIPQARTAMAERFADLDPAALVFACRNNLALVQVPPRGVWGRAAQVTLATTEGWLGRSPEIAPRIDEVVLRYLGAFGPALVADVAAWSGLQAMREVLERLRPRLRTFRDERGRELFDLPDAPRPDPDTPAPVRFLPEYDNVLLSHSDRSRFSNSDPAIPRLWTVPSVRGSVLVEGQVRAAWTLERDPSSGGVTLTVLHTGLAKKAQGATAAEGRRLLRFLEAGATGHEVRFVLVD